MANKKAIYSPEHEVLVRLLREARQAAGLTQTQLAERLGKKTHSAIVKMEQGQVRVEVIELRRICLALGVPLRAFIERLESEIDRLGDG
jgi:transcriptional regulator with XRE-family HTH domain